MFCRSRKMLQNEYLDAKIGVDTAENEPFEVSRKWGFTVEVPGIMLTCCAETLGAPDLQRTSALAAGATSRAVLVEKFDTELFSDFSAKSSNFRRLVLSCINADFCVQILILQRFSRSTRLSNLCTARNSKYSQKFVKIFHILIIFLIKI